MKPPKPVTIRGTVFSSVGAAARALGVTRRAVQLARDAGRLDKVGTGPARPDQRRGAQGRFA